MPVFAPATDQSEIVLPEPDRYLVKCLAIEDAPDKGFGPGVKWVFELTHAATGERLPNELWQFTSIKMGPKSKARPIIEALLGRPLENREVPDPDKLIGRTMVAMVIHEKRDDGTDKAVVSSCKPYADNGTVSRPRPAPRASGQGGLLEQIKGAIRKAEVLGTPKHLDWIALDLDGMSDSDMYMTLEEINADIQAA